MRKFCKLMNILSEYVGWMSAILYVICTISCLHDLIANHHTYLPIYLLVIALALMIIAGFMWISENILDGFINFIKIIKSIPEWHKENMKNIKELYK